MNSMWSEHTVDSGHDEANLGRVGGAGEMRVDLLRFVLIQRDETVQNVVASGSIVRTTFRSVSKIMS